MDTTQEPNDIVQSWQNWYKNNKVVASIEEPMATKNSRENLHDTSKTTNSVFKTEIINSAKNCFADTIAMYLSDLSSSQLYECFLDAALDNLNYTEKEYKKAKELVDLFKTNQN